MENITCQLAETKEATEAMIGLMSAALTGFGLAMNQDRELAIAMAKGIISLQDALPKEFMDEYTADLDMKMALQIVKMVAES